MSFKERAVRGALWSACQNVAAKAINFCVFVVLARLLAPQDFGLVALVGVTLAFMQLFIDQGFEEAIVQRDQVDGEHLDATFWFCVALGVFLVILIVASAPLVSRMFGEPRLQELLAVSSLAVFASSLGKVPSGLLRREFSFRTLALRQIFAAAVGGAVGVLLALRGYGAWSLIWRLVAESTTGLLVLWIGSRWRPRFVFSWKHLKDILSFGSPLMLTNLFNFFNARGDSLIIGYFLGPAALGLYSVAQRLFLLLLELVHGTINQVALSVFARLQKEPDRLKSAFLVAVRWTSLASFPLFMLLAVSAEQVVPAMFGNQWKDAAPVVSVLSVGGLLFAVSYYNAGVMKALGKSGWVLGLVALNAVVNMAGFYIGASFGIVGVAAAYVLRGYLVYPANLILLRKLINLRIKEYIACLGPAFYSSLAGGLIAYGLLWCTGGQNLWVRLAVAITGGVGLYALILIGFWPHVVRSAAHSVWAVLPRR